MLNVIFFLYLVNFTHFFQHVLLIYIPKNDFPTLIYCVKGVINCGKIGKGKVKSCKESDV